MENENEVVQPIEEKPAEAAPPVEVPAEAKPEASPESEGARKNQIEVRQISLLEFRAKTFDDKDKSVEMVWTTGAKVLRRPFFGEPFYEELSMDPKHIRLERLNSGSAPLLAAHNQFELNAVIGVVDSVKMEDGQGVAKVRFSERDEVKPIIGDVKAGILKNVSVGYTIHKFEKVEGGEGVIPTLRAVDWEPMELSIVPIGADPKAHIRSIESVNSTEINERGNQMDKEKEAKLAERKRISQIRAACEKAKLSKEFAEKLVNEDVSIEAAREQIIDALAESQAPEIKPQVRIESGDQDEKLVKRAAVESHLLHRYNSKKYQVTEAGREYMGMSLVELARSFVSTSKGLTKSEIVERAMHSTSDFPFILANVANKTLRDAYEAAPRTYQPIVREVTVPDFKTVSRTQLGEGEVLEKVLEGGEIHYGTISEAREQYALATYGKIVKITRAAIVNDDLGAFTRIPELQGRRVADLESDLVWEQITSNPTMGDSIALFHASHANLGSAGAISVTTLGELKKLMRLQVGLDSQKLNIQPVYLIVPATKESLAEQFLSTSVFADSASSVNPFAGKLKLIVEPRLDAASSTAYYMAAESSQIDVIELARLEGQVAPFMEMKEGFEIDGVMLKVRHDVAAKVIDFRGLAKNAGA